MANITLMGGGSSAHVLAGLLGSTGHSVSIFSRQPRRWNSVITVRCTTPEGEEFHEISGKIHRAATTPAQAAAEAEVVLLCMPVSSYRAALDQLAPALPSNRTIYIGTVYGQGGFDWMFADTKQRYELGDNVVPFAFGLLPWITRTLEYGSEAALYTEKDFSGIKQQNIIALGRDGSFNELQDLLLHDVAKHHFGRGSFILTDDFLTLTLSTDNQIIHTSRMYSLHQLSAGHWPTERSVPYFYRDYDQFSADTLLALDKDYNKVRASIRGGHPHLAFTGMLDYLELECFTYGRQSVDIKSSFTESNALGSIKTPVIRDNQGRYILDPTHRFFSDDIFYGLVIAKWLGIKHSIETPMIDTILNWASKYLGENILDSSGNFSKDSPRYKPGGHSGIPDAYQSSSVAALVSQL